MNQDIKNILAALDTVNETISFEFFSPTLNSKLKSKILNTDQLKRLYKSLVDSPLQNSIFTLALNEIIKENIITENIDVNKLNVLDKIIYFIALRANSISNTYTIKLEDSDIVDNNLNVTTKEIAVDLSDILNKFLDGIGGIGVAELSIDSVTPYIVVCSLPTIKIENLFEKEVNKIVKMEVNTPEELREFVGNAFINEVTKYIKSFSLDGINVISLDGLDFKTRSALVSKFPSTVINKVLKYMEHFKTLTETLTIIKKELSIKDSTEKFIFNKPIPMDASFFNE